MLGLMEFEDALGRLGFTLSGERGSKRPRAYAASPNRYLTFWVHALDDGTALFTWEFAVAEYLSSKGILLGSAEVLNLFMFPAADQTGPQDAEWVADAMARAEATLAAVDFAHPSTGS
jgi:hypothetical protein